jgi:hypothetical protein
MHTASFLDVQSDLESLEQLPLLCFFLNELTHSYLCAIVALFQTATSNSMAELHDTTASFHSGFVNNCCWQIRHAAMLNVQVVGLQTRSHPA